MGKGKRSERDGWGEAPLKGFGKVLSSGANAPACSARGGVAKEEMKIAS